MCAADHARSRVIELGHLGHIVLGMVVREGLDEHDRAARRQRLRGVLRRADRIAKIVQRVEEADQVVFAWIILRPSEGEVGPLPGLRILPRCCEGSVVIVEPEEARVREGLRHQQCRMTVAAADVGHVDALLQALHHAV